MSKIIGENDYIYETIETEEDARTCARLIADEFSLHNDLTRFDQITPERFFDDCSWPIVSDMYNEGLCFLARHRLSNEIVGSLIAGDLYSHAVQTNSTDASKTSYTIPLDYLLEEMDELFIKKDFGRELEPNMVLHIEMCAVRAQHSGRKIASQILTKACENARDRRGFQYALAQVVHDATRHLFIDKLGGIVLSTIDPKTWLWKHDDGECTVPYKDYSGPAIPNVLLQL